MHRNVSHQSTWQSRADHSIPSTVESLEAAHSSEGSMPVHEEALSLPQSCALRQGLASQAVAPLPLCCLPPLLQVVPLHSSLQLH